MSKIKTIATVLPKVVSKSPVSPLSAVDALTMLIKAHQDYHQISQTEQTKRQAISAWSDVQVTKLNAQKELLQDYLSHTFAERRVVIDGMFKCLDEGISKGNSDLINNAMSSILDVVKSSPLQEAEKLINAMNDPNVQKIEF